LKNIRSSVTIPRATKHFKPLLKRAEKKVKSGMKILISRYLTLKQIDSLKS